MQVRSEWELQQRLENLARRERHTLARLQYAAAVPDMIPTKRQQQLRMLSYNANHRLTTNNAPILCAHLPHRMSCNSIRAGVNQLLSVPTPIEKLIATLPQYRGTKDNVKENIVTQDTLVNYSDTARSVVASSSLPVDVAGTFMTSSDTASLASTCYISKHTDSMYHSHCTANHTSLSSFTPTSANNIPPDRVELWFGGCNCPIAVELQNTTINPWSDSEKLIYADKFMQYPKDFPTIASFLPNKTASDCIAYYYATKHVAGYKLRLKAAGLAARRKGGAQTGWLQACGAARDVGVPIHSDTARGGWLKDKAKKVVNVSQRVQDLSYSRLFIHPGPYARIHSLHRFITIPLPLTTILSPTALLTNSNNLLTSVATPHPLSTPSKGDKNKGELTSNANSVTNNNAVNPFSNLPKDVRNEFVFAYGLGYASLPWSSKFQNVISTEQSPDPLTYMPHVAAMQAGSGTGIGGSLVRVYMAADALTRSEARKHASNNAKYQYNLLQQCTDLAKLGLMCPGHIDPGKTIPPSLLPFYGTVFGAIGNGPAGLSYARFPILPTVLGYLNDYISNKLLPLLMEIILYKKNNIPTSSTTTIYQQAKEITEKICLPLRSYDDDRIIGFAWRLLSGNHDDQFNPLTSVSSFFNSLMDTNTNVTAPNDNNNNSNNDIPLGISTLLPIQSRLRLASLHWKNLSSNSSYILSPKTEDNSMKIEEPLPIRGVPDIAVPELVTATSSFTSTMKTIFTEDSKPVLRIHTGETTSLTGTSSSFSKSRLYDTKSNIPLDLHHILEYFPTSLRSLIEYLIHTSDAAKYVLDTSNQESITSQSTLSVVSSPSGRKSKKQAEIESNTSTNISTVMSAALNKLSLVSTGEFFTPNGPTATLRYFDPLGTPYSYYGHGDIAGIFPHVDLLNEARAYDIADINLARKARRIYHRNGVLTHPPPHLRSKTNSDDEMVEEDKHFPHPWNTRKTSLSNQTFLSNIQRSSSELTTSSIPSNEAIAINSGIITTSHSHLTVSIDDDNVPVADSVEASPYVSEAEDQPPSSMTYSSGIKRSTGHLESSTHHNKRIRVDENEDEQEEISERSDHYGEPESNEGYHQTIEGEDGNLSYPQEDYHTEHYDNTYANNMNDDDTNNNLDYQEHRDQYIPNNNEDDNNNNNPDESYYPEDNNQQGIVDDDENYQDNNYAYNNDNGGDEHEQVQQEYTENYEDYNQGDENMYNNEQGYDNTNDQGNEEQSYNYYQEEHGNYEENTGNMETNDYSVNNTNKNDNNDDDDI